MGFKTWRIDPGNHYIRRRDKELVEVTSNKSMQVEYKLRKTGALFKVSIDGFRRGFRPATAEELVHALVVDGRAAESE